MTTKQKMHVDPYEKNWMRLTAVLLVVFAAAVTVAGFMMGIQVPTNEQRVNPATVAEEGPWADSGLRELAPGKYEAYILAQVWQFTPREIRIPAGSEITFYVTSRDLQHGFKLQDTNINMMIIPGQVSKLKTVFDKPGTYNFICTEYCGIGHAAMFGTLIVEE